MSLRKFYASVYDINFPRLLLACVYLFFPPCGHKPPPTLRERLRSLSYTSCVFAFLFLLMGQKITYKIGNPTNRIVVALGELRISARSK